MDRAGNLTGTSNDGSSPTGSGSFATFLVESLSFEGDRNAFLTALNHVPFFPIPTLLNDSLRNHLHAMIHLNKPLTIRRKARLILKQCNPLQSLIEYSSHNIDVAVHRKISGCTSDYSQEIEHVHSGIALREPCTQVQ